VSLAAIYERLTPIVRDVFEDDALTASEDLTAENVEGWDSFAHLRLIMTAERTFAIAFSAQEIIDVRTLGDLATLIAAKTAS
jgi:acyl carrier protein